MSNGFEVEDPGGPDRRFDGQSQDEVDVVLNQGSFMFAQSGVIHAGDLVTFKLFDQYGVPVEQFYVRPIHEGAKLPLATGTRRIPGRNGRTKKIQAISSHGAFVARIKFVVEIGEWDPPNPLPEIIGQGYLLVKMKEKEAADYPV